MLLVLTHKTLIPDPGQLLKAVEYVSHRLKRHTNASKQITNLSWPSSVGSISVNTVGMAATAATFSD